MKWSDLYFGFLKSEEEHIEPYIAAYWVLESV